MKSFYFNSRKFFTGLYNYTFTKKINPIEKFKQFEVFRVLDEQGKILDKSFDNIPKETCLKIFKTMVQSRNYDVRFIMAQREGKISFYIPSTGEEAASAASIAALSDQDIVYGHYRESPIFIYRGYTIQDIANQLTGNDFAIGKGKNLPVCYTFRKGNIQNVKPPLATQLPQAAGAGYHFRVQNMDKVCAAYFGEGSASEGEFHAALNFASTLGAQTLYLCRNNCYSISTPSDEQYSGDGIAVQGVSYGIASLRVDGNDPIAVYHATNIAREYIMTKKRPFLIEFITYRVGDHSTSDYSKLYRNDEEMKKWNELLKNIGDPIERFMSYLKYKNWMTDTDYKKMVEDTQEETRTSLKKAIAAKKPSVDSLFDDVYEKIPNILKEQRNELREHLDKYQDKFNMNYQKESTEIPSTNPKPKQKINFKRDININQDKKPDLFEKE